MSDNTSASGKDKWTRADKINSLIAATACLGVVAVAIPLLVRLKAHLDRPQVTIVSPANGSIVTTRHIAAAGYATNIPPGDALWVVVNAGIQGRWYPKAHIQSEPGNR